MPDDLWDRVAPLLPSRPPRRRRYPGRLPADDRAELRGIVHVLRTGVTRADVPSETIGCSGVTCWRHLRDWTEAGVWPRLHEILLAELRAAGLLDMDDSTIDGSHVRALKGGNYPSQFKADAVALYQSRPEATIRQVAADLGINPETLRIWVRAAGASRPRGRRAEVPTEPPAPLEAENTACARRSVS